MLGHLSWPQSCTRVTVFCAGLGGVKPVTADWGVTGADAAGPKRAYVMSSTDATGGFDGNVRVYEATKGDLVRSFVPVPIKAAAVQQAAR